jgi:hypothetical protein
MLLTLRFLQRAFRRATYVAHAPYQSVRQFIAMNVRTAREMSDAQSTNRMTILRLALRTSKREFGAVRYFGRRKFVPFAPRHPAFACQVGVRSLVR